MSSQILTTDLPGLTPFIRGKVRDVYDLGEHLLMIATDRISAFDSVLPTGIPDKGKVLNQLSAFWFGRHTDLCPHHIVSTDLGEIQAAVRAAGGEAPAEVIAGRSSLVVKTQTFPVECVVRGYLEGSGWKEYQRSQSVCGIALPAGLKQGSRLPEPLFTPSTKATTGHDENITHDQMGTMVSKEHMDELIRLSLGVYNAAAAYALEKGIIIADTKFEFGLLGERVIMIDECLTPDSSRFWSAEKHAPGGPQASLDKQYVRDYLDGIGWNHEPPAPPLPSDVAETTAAKYREIYTLLSGKPLE
jgi:phosphoribosylaminoimidazole-succinocarboxamide synthase